MNKRLSLQLGSSELSSNLRVLTLRNFLYGWHYNMRSAIWQPFVLSLGASMPLVGLLESIGGFGGIVSTAMLPLGGWLSDRRGRRPFIILSSLFGFAAAATFVLAAWVQEWRLLVFGAVLLGLTAIARPAIDSFTAESATADARGRAFSLVTSAFAASGIFAPTLGGFLASRYGFLLTLVLGASLELMVLILVTAALRETMAAGERPPLARSQFLALIQRSITPPARLRVFYVAVTIDMFAYGVGATILPGLLTRTYAFTPLQIGLISTMNSVVWAISQMSFGHAVDRRGRVPFLVLSEALGVLVTGGWLLARSFEVFLLLSIVSGLIPATWVPSYLSWIVDSVPEGQRAEEMGRLGAFRGLLAFPAPYVGGLLYNVFGFAGPILANMIGAALVMFIFWLFVGEPQPCQEKGVTTGDACQ